MAVRIKFLLIVLVLTGWANAAAPAKNVILIGWDGAQRNHVMEALDRGELPTLKMLSKEGHLVKIDIEGTTDTKAGWAQILTGYYPTVTGVYSNGKYCTIPQGLTIGERCEEYFGPTKIYTAAVIGKKGHVDDEKEQLIKITDKNKAEIDRTLTAKVDKNGKMKKPDCRIIDINGVEYFFSPGKPYYNMSKNTDLFENGLVLDERVGKRVIDLLEKHKKEKFFFFVHFAEVDHAGHNYGENSKQYNDALISNDKWTGKIIDKLKELGIYDDTIIYVTADHGFNEGAANHNNAPYVFLATNSKKLIRDGRRQDIAPTIYETLGFDLSQITPKLDGISLTQKDTRPPAKLGPDEVKTKIGKKGRKKAPLQKL